MVLVGRRVRFDVTAIDTEESVPTFRRFWRQRYRWARGHQQAWREYRRRHVAVEEPERRPQVSSRSMFLLVYHVPVFCMLGLVFVVPPRRRRAHLGQRAGPHAGRDAAVPRTAHRARLGADRQPRAPSGRRPGSCCSSRRSCSSPWCARSRGSTGSSAGPTPGSRRPAAGSASSAPWRCRREPRRAQRDRPPGLAFGATIGVFWLLITPWRDVEAQVIAHSFQAMGVPRASQVFGNQILVLPAHAAPFLATISPSCSALAAILGFAAISLFVVGGSLQRRIARLRGRRARRARVQLPADRPVDLRRGADERPGHDGVPRLGRDRLRPLVRARRLHPLPVGAAAQQPDAR